MHNTLTDLKNKTKECSYCLIEIYHRLNNQEHFIIIHLDKVLTNPEEKKRVLIVEDDVIISLVIENMVKELGHDVVGKATTGEEAIKLAVTHSPDLLLMDIRLKGEMDGIEAVTEIKQKIKTSVIYLTGNSDRVNYERARETEFIDLITKPFTISDLTRSLNLV